MPDCHRKARNPSPPRGHLSGRLPVMISTMSRNALTTAVAILIVGYVMAVPSTIAGTTVYKCVKDGQITLTDKPCPNEKGSTDSSAGQSTASVVPSSKDPSPVGKWSGQIQYQEASNGQTVQAAHSVALLSAEFTADGKVMGSSPENGCQLLGVWSAGGQTLNWVDLTLSNCRYPDLNRRYHGSLILARPDSSGNLQVQSIGTSFSKDTAKVFDVKGTLRR
jgi:Domain of unknown function (DUF4124)